MYKKQKVTQEDFLSSLEEQRSEKSPFRGKRVGVYAGVFNPVHAGHVAFALQIMKTAKLDKLVFLPERLPRHKPDVEHFGHRVAMLRRAIRPYKDMAVLELVGKQFTIARTLPQIRSTFSGATLIFLMGSDTIEHLPQWPGVAKLLSECELAIGVRQGQSTAKISKEIGTWEVRPKHYIVESFAPDVSSTQVREALRAREHTSGLLASVRKYAHRNWLYVSLKNAEKNV